MKTKPFYLVIDVDRRAVVKARQSWPQLDPGQIILRLAVEIPERLIPQVTEIVLEEEDLEALGIAVEPVAL